MRYLFVVLGLFCGLNSYAQTNSSSIESAGQTTTVAPLPAGSLTPPSPPTPGIHGARVFGVRPGHPFLFTIAATGDRTMTFAADHLPQGLTLDAHSGQIAGRIEKPGTYEVMLHASNALGEAKSKFKIVCGDTLALTPHMG